MSMEGYGGTGLISDFQGLVITVYNTLHTFLIIHVLCGKICKIGLYTELFYAIIPACFLTFCCSAIPTSPYISLMYSIAIKG